MKKIVRLTESDITRIVNKVIKEQRVSDLGHPIINIGGVDIEYVADNVIDPKNEYEYMVYFNIPDNYDEEEFTQEELDILIPNLTKLGFKDVEELGPGTLYGVGDIEMLDWLENHDSSDFAEKREREKSMTLTPKPKRTLPGDKIIDFLNTPEEDLHRHYQANIPDELSDKVLKKYIFPIMEWYKPQHEPDIYTYYNNLIQAGIIEYIKSEEPERLKRFGGQFDDWPYLNNLFNSIKYYWMPI